MRSGQAHDEDVQAATAQWTDPQSWAANAAGQVTSVQWSLIAGQKIRPPYFAWILLMIWAAILGGAGWAGGTPRDYPSGIPNGGVSGALAAVGLAAAVTFLWFPGLALMVGFSRWRARRRRRGRIADLAACRIDSALGCVVVLDDGGSQARAGTRSIPVPEGAPALPSPGPYRLYWLESARGKRSPVLLSAQPVDAREATDLVDRDTR
jgi:hypothetical protein